MRLLKVFLTYCANPAASNSFVLHYLLRPLAMYSMFQTIHSTLYWSVAG